MDWLAPTAPSVAVILTYVLSRYDRRRVARDQDQKLADAQADVAGRIAEVHGIVNGQHDALQALSDAQGVTIKDRDATIKGMQGDADRP